MLPASSSQFRLVVHCHRATGRIFLIVHFSPDVVKDPDFLLMERCLLSNVED